MATDSRDEEDERIEARRDDDQEGKGTVDSKKEYSMDTIESIAKNREDLMKEIQELSNQRKDIETRLKGLDRDVRYNSRPFRERRDWDSRDRNGTNARGSALSSIVRMNNKRRRGEEGEEEEQDDDQTDEEDGGSGKRRKLYIRKSKSGDGRRGDERNSDEEDGNDDGRNKPSVSSAVVSSHSSRRRRSTPLSGDKSLQKRNRRMMGILMGHLGKARKIFQEDKRKPQYKKKKNMEEKVEARTAEVRMEVREHAKRRAERKRMKELKVREDLLKKQREKYRQLLKLRLVEHERLLSNFIKTEQTPSVFWMPASHTDETEKLLEKAKEVCEEQVKGKLGIDFEDEEDSLPPWRNFAENAAAGDDAEGKDGKMGDGEAKDGDGDGQKDGANADSNGDNGKSTADADDGDKTSASKQEKEEEDDDDDEGRARGDD
eukprot:jgi/Bigna1/73139/fgenesh1_pg.23_\